MGNFMEIPNGVYGNSRIWSVGFQGSQGGDLGQLFICS